MPEVAQELTGSASIAMVLAAVMLVAGILLIFRNIFKARFRAYMMRRHIREALKSLSKRGGGE